MRGFPVLLFLVFSVGCTGPIEVAPEQQYKIAFIYQNDSGGMAIATVTPDGKSFTAVHEAGVIFSVKWSPSGTKLAHDIYDADVIVVNADGSNPKMLGIGSVGTSYCWSQDETKIFFSALDTIYSVEIQTGTLKNITRGSSPAISPTGDEIAFVRGPFLYVSKLDGSGENMISGSYVQYPVWAPNGESIAYLDAASGLWVTGRTGKENRRIVDAGNVNSAPSWSPDTSKLTYSSDEGIFVINTNGSGNSKIASSGYNPQWSPDGKYVTYGGGPDGLMLVKPDGTGNRKLWSVKAIYRPAWSPVPIH